MTIVCTFVIPLLMNAQNQHCIIDTANTISLLVVTSFTEIYFSTTMQNKRTIMNFRSVKTMLLERCLRHTETHSAHLPLDDCRTVTYYQVVASSAAGPSYAAADVTYAVLLPYSGAYHNQAPSKHNSLYIFIKCSLKYIPLVTVRTKR